MSENSSTPKEFDLLHEMAEAERQVHDVPRGHLFARIHPPSALLDDERYEVDLKMGEFRAVHAGEVASRGKAQLIATFLPGAGTCMWGWANPSVTEGAYREVRGWFEKQPSLAALTQTKEFAVDQDRLDIAANYVAVKMGYLACYPALVDDSQTVAFLAVELDVHGGTPAEPGKNHWCSFCGKLPFQAEKFIAGSDGRGICSQCGDNFLQMFSTKELEQDIDAGLVSGGGVRCSMCEGDEGIVAHDFSCICKPCLKFALEVLAEA